MFKKIFCIVLICSSWAWGQQQPKNPDQKIYKVYDEDFLEDDKIKTRQVVKNIAKKMKDYKNVQGYLDYLKQNLEEKDFLKSKAAILSHKNKHEHFANCEAEDLILRCGGDTLQFIQKNIIIINNAYFYIYDLKKKEYDVILEMFDVDGTSSSKSAALLFSLLFNKAHAMDIASILEWNTSSAAPAATTTTTTAAAANPARRGIFRSISTGLSTAAGWIGRSLLIKTGIGLAIAVGVNEVVNAMNPITVLCNESEVVQEGQESKKSFTICADVGGFQGLNIRGLWNEYVGKNQRCFSYSGLKNKLYADTPFHSSALVNNPRLQSMMVNGCNDTNRKIYENTLNKIEGDSVRLAVYNIANLKDLPLADITPIAGQESTTSSRWTARSTLVNCIARLSDCPSATSVQTGIQRPERPNEGIIIRQGLDVVPQDGNRQIIIRGGITTTQVPSENNRAISSDSPARKIEIYKVDKPKKRKVKKSNYENNKFEAI